MPPPAPTCSWRGAASAPGSPFLLGDEQFSVMEELLGIGATGGADRPVPPQVLVDDRDDPPGIIEIVDGLAASTDGLGGLGAGRMLVCSEPYTEGALLSGLEETTLVSFTSDNGAPAYIGLPRVNEPFRGWKISFFEGGSHVPYLLKWPARRGAGRARLRARR